MSLIYIDGKEYRVDSQDNLLQACLTLGIDIPYFCWHPELGSIGACRQCAIKKYKNKDDKCGSIVMSCMTPSLNGTLISTNDKEVQDFRKIIIELLMINHPHDCPVCEEGGHCHLQDMTVMNKHYSRRYRFNKRTHNNQFLGPFITHEMNRCITCYRCLRYYKDYAEGKDFGVYGMHDNIYFGRNKSGMLESEFSGNLVEICPTGVFTDKTYSDKYVRKWDMQFSPSICHHCSIGCNISIGERYGKIRRIENRYHGDLNHYFICDLGRFGHEYSNLKNRPLNPLKLNENKYISINYKESINEAIYLLKKSKKIIGIGSDRASLESNFALLQLVGKENFSIGLLSKEKNSLDLIIKIISKGGIYTPSLREVEKYDAILILGEDITQTSARLALSIRQAVKNKIYNITNDIPQWNILAVKNHGQNERHPLFITNVDKTNLDEISLWNYHAPVSDQARLGFAISHIINNNSPKVGDMLPELQKKADIIAKTLLKAKKPLIISGMHSNNISIIESAANIAKALKTHNPNVGIILLPNAANSIGLGIINGKSLESALKLLDKKNTNTLIILENDIYRRIPKKYLDENLKKYSKLIVLDHIKTKTTDKADLIFSSTSFAESCGTIVNNEGRAQRFFSVCNRSWYNDKVKILDSWEWINKINKKFKNKKNDLLCHDDVINSIVEKIPKLKKIKEVAPNSKFKIHGQKIARSPNRFSGRTAMMSNINIHESSQPQDKNSMFSYSMEGSRGLINNQYIPFSWYPKWNSVQSWNKYQKKIGGELISGNSGIRLFKINKNQTLDWFKEIPIEFNKNKKNKWCIAPYYHLFGSEEMTQLSPNIKQLIPTSYAIISYLDKSIIKNEYINFCYMNQLFSFPIRFSKTLQKGQIGIPIGFVDVPIYLNNVYVDII